MVPISAFESFTNDAAGIVALSAFCRRHGAELAVMEATGGYERMAFLLLWQEGVPCALTNPRGVRRFAEAMGALEKTDRIDAGMIARFAIAKDVKATQPPSPSQQLLKALIVRLRQVKGDLTIRSNGAPPRPTPRSWPVSTR
jgi:transposase